MIILLAIGLVILIMVLIGLAVDKKEEAMAEAETEEEAKIEAEREELIKLTKSINSFKAWWLNSRFNSFIVLEKRTPMHFNGKRYMAVRHTVTNECYNLDVDVTTYFNYDVGAELSMTNMDYDYITAEAFAEFTAETGVSLSWLDFSRKTELDYKYTTLELLNSLRETRTYD